MGVQRVCTEGWKNYSWVLSVGVQRVGTEGWKNYSWVQKVGRMVLSRFKENVQMDGRSNIWLAKVIVPEDGRMFLRKFKENV